MTQPQEEDHLARCLELFERYQHRLRSLIRAILVSPADVDEVLHETNITIWQKVDQFDPTSTDRNFLSWAMQIARLKTLEHLRKLKSQGIPALNEGLADQLAQVSQSEAEELARRREALTTCLQKLNSADRAVIDRCYAYGASVPEIAQQMGRTATSLYRSLRRIRQALSACIERQLAAEGRS